MIRTYQRIQRRRAAGEIEGGFTLIELLIVIVVLGILAAIVVFALGGVTGKSAAAACQSDAKTVGIGVGALMAENPNITSNSALTEGSAASPATGTGGASAAGGWQWALTATGALTADGNVISGDSFLQSWPTSSSYTVKVSDGTTNNAWKIPAGATLATTQITAPFGDVLVSGTNATTATGAAPFTSKSYSFDATANPVEACNWAVLGKA